MLLWKANGSVSVLGTGKRMMPPSHTRQRNSQVSLWATSSYLKDRIDLGIQVVGFGERVGKGDSTETSGYLNLPGTPSQIGWKSPAIPPDLASSVQICTGVPAMSSPDGVPPGVPLVVPLNHRYSSPPKRVIGESSPKRCYAEVLSACHPYENLKRRSSGT
jgi:hypothetical protein